MEQDLVTVGTFDSRAEADLCKVFLEQEGIQAFVADANLVGGANWLFSNAVHGIKVDVPAADAARAVEVLSRFEQNRARTIETDLEEDDANAPRIEVVCESCGKTVAFPAVTAGTTQACPECRNYIDVPAV